MSRDSIVGKSGIVTRTIEPDNISGKVTIDNVEWSAKTQSETIAKGKKVRVVASQGVHVIVEEI